MSRTKSELSVSVPERSGVEGVLLVCCCFPLGPSAFQFFYFFLFFGGKPRTVSLQNERTKMKFCYSMSHTPPTVQTLALLFSSVLHTIWFC